MFYKVVYILISLRGDSKSMRYVVTLHIHTYTHTHNLQNLYINLGMLYNFLNSDRILYWLVNIRNFLQLRDAIFQYGQ